MRKEMTIREKNTHIFKTDASNCNIDVKEFRDGEETETK